MLYFLYGQELYLLKEALRELILNLSQKNKGRQVEIKRFSQEQGGLKTLWGELNNLELFSSFKIFIIEEAFKDPGAQDFLEMLSGPSYSYAFIIVEQGVPKKNSKLFRFLLENAQAKECRPLEGQELFCFAKKEFAKYKVKIQHSAITQLIDKVGNDLWRMTKEIQKLSAAAKDNTISQKDIARHVKDLKGVNIFETISALALRQKSKAIKLISNHLAQGENPLYLFSMVVYQFRVLLQIKDLWERNLNIFQIQKKTGFHPFVIKKSLTISSLFSKEKLVSVYRLLSAFDFQIKIGQIKPETALELFLAKPI